MAFIEKRPSGNHQVRWVDPDGRSRARTVPTLRAAKQLQREVEDHVSRGHRWEPRDVRPIPDLRVIAEAYLTHCAPRLRHPTLEKYARDLEVFFRFLQAVGHRRRPTADVLSKPTLEQFHQWLRTPGTGLHGSQRGPDTARKMVEVVQLMWRWADDSERWPDVIPRPRTLRMRRSRPRRVRAPTWAEMDRCIAASQGCQRRLLVVLRYTGLRVGETMKLRWDDLDMERGELFIDAAINKTGEARTIPVSPHLLDEVAGWERRDGFLVPWEGSGGSCDRRPRTREVSKAWTRAGVLEHVWRGSPHHAFRRGFKTEMLAAGATADAVDVLQGHVIRGGRGRYIDVERAFDWNEILALIPPTPDSPEARRLRL